MLLRVFMAGAGVGNTGIKTPLWCAAGPGSTPWTMHGLLSTAKNDPGTAQCGPSTVLGVTLPGFSVSALQA